MARDLTSSLIKTQLPSFFEDEGSKLPIFLEKYYEFLESKQFHFTNLILNEYTPTLEDNDDNGDIILEGVGTTGSLILESFRNVDEDAFEVGEIITGTTSKATAEVIGTQKFGDTAGGHSMTTPHHLYVKPLTGKFILNETFTGSANRTQATLSEVSDQGVLNYSRGIEDAADILETDSANLEKFRKEFIPHLPRTSRTDLQKLITLAGNVYRSRGSEDSFKWLWRAVYAVDEELEFSYPKEFILKVSDANWNAPINLLIDNGTANNVTEFAGRVITGDFSKATAIVQLQETLTIPPYNLTKLTVSDVSGTFVSSEKISTNSSSTTVAEATLVNQISSINIDSGGTSYNVGDELTISGGGGTGAKASVNTVTSGAVNEVEVSDGGDGYFGTETFTYFSTSGSGASSKATSIQQSGSAKVFGNNVVITPFASVQINAANYGSTLAGVNVNTHFNSNGINTFLATVDDSSNFAKGHFITDTANNIIGTVIAVPNSTSIVYAIQNESLPNFYGGTNGSSVKAYFANNTVVSGASATVSLVVANTATSNFGCLSLTETAYGSIKTSTVTTVGSNFLTAPSITATQSTITAFNNDDGILGPRSRFLNLAANVQFLFTHGKTLQGQTSGAAGTVLDPYIDARSNSTFSVLRYKKIDTQIVLNSTDGSADAGDNILLEDGFHAAHGSYSGTSSIQGQFKMEDTDFIADEPVLQLTTTANSTTASSNVFSIDNSLRGNNAVINSGNLSIGSISSLSITDFGIAYSSIPTITTTTGDENAVLTAEIGPLSISGGSYTNEDSLISGKDKIQDSYYYQDFSYVLKTDLPINNFRDTVKSFVHPAGWALFGEIAIRNTLDSTSLDFAPTSAGLVLELDPLNVNFLSANANLTELHLNFIETRAAINPASDLIQTPEYVVRFKVPDSLNVTHTVASNNEIQIEPSGLSSGISTSEVDSLQTEIETTLATTITSDTNVSRWFPIGDAAFTEANDNIIRTMPTIQDFLNTFSPPETLSTLTLNEYAGLQALHVAGTQFNPNSVAGDEIYLADINLTLEDDHILIDSTNGSADAGDKFLLEDGFNPTDGSYSGTSSTLGQLIGENEIFLFEDDTWNEENKRIRLHQKEEAKYIVQAANSSTITIFNSDQKYLPAELNDFNTEAFVLRDTHK